MKNIFKLITFLFVFIGFFSSPLLANDFRVWIEQNGEIINPNKGSLTLDKTELCIVFEFSEPMGLLVNGSFEKKTFDMATQGKPLSELHGFHNTGMAEGLLNAERDILISDDSPNYWFYDDPEQNRFDSVEEVNGKYVCRRTIQNLYDVEGKKTIRIENVEHPLYLVFISFEYEEDFTQQIELKREWIEINWKD